jgi:hypothetical protein
MLRALFASSGNSAAGKPRQRKMARARLASLLSVIVAALVGSAPIAAVLLAGGF